MALDADGQVRWEYLQSKRTHTHDVRVLVAFSPPGRDELLVSGGNDAQLFAHLLHRFTKVGLSRSSNPAVLIRKMRARVLVKRHAYLSATACY